MRSSHSFALPVALAAAVLVSPALAAPKHAAPRHFVRMAQAMPGITPDAGAERSFEELHALLDRTLDA